MDHRRFYPNYIDLRALSHDMLRKTKYNNAVPQDRLLPDIVRSIVRNSRLTLNKTKNKGIILCSKGRFTHLSEFSALSCCWLWGRQSSMQWEFH
jgi:hypothetical protein